MRVDEAVQIRTTVINSDKQRFGHGYVVVHVPQSVRAPYTWSMAATAVATRLNRYCPTPRSCGFSTDAADAAICELRPALIRTEPVGDDARSSCRPGRRARRPASPPHRRITVARASTATRPLGHRSRTPQIRLYAGAGQGFHRRLAASR